MAEASEEIKIIESCKKKLIEKFITNPDFFLQELDMHCYLYSELLRSPRFTCQSEMGEISFVHREYPTNLIYAKDKSKIYFPVTHPTRGKQHGKIDLVILDTADPKPNERGFCRIKHGIEIKFEARHDVSYYTKDTKQNIFKNIYQDYRKLTDKENEIRFKHMLYFVKGEVTKFKVLEDIEAHIEAESKSYSGLVDVKLRDIYFTYIEWNPYESARIIRSFE